MITAADVHWLAGFFDGEGCVFISPNGGHAIRATITQKDRWPLEKVERLIGVAPKLRSGHGKYANEHYWHTDIIGAKAVGLIMTLYPLLSPRRQLKIREALAHWRGQQGKGAFNRAKTHCKHGHELTPANTYPKKGLGKYAGRIYRECVICRDTYERKVA